jgi:hypothetical protein
MWLFESHVYVFLEPRAYKFICFASYIKWDVSYKHIEGQIKSTPVDKENPLRLG